MRYKNVKTIMIAAVISLLGITVAFAALSTNLSLTFGTITQNALTWSVGFTGTSATATAGGTSATGRSCGTATITTTAVTLGNTTLSKPGDSCIYALTIKNSGGIAAKLGTITPTAPTSVTCGTASGANLVCGNITYRLTSDSAGATLLTTGGTIAANGTKTIYLVAEFTGSSPSASAVTQTGAKFQITYNQA